MKFIFIFICCFTSALVGQTSIDQLSFLEGTWKVENKEQYEVWGLTDSKILEGYAYKMKNGHKSITETLSITTENKNLFYNATVPDQNNGITVTFIWNKKNVVAWSFENETHDFPKKIIYNKISDTILEVSVVGKNDTGFSYKMTKQ